MSDRPSPRRIRFDSLEERVTPSSVLGVSTAIVYSDPTAPPEPHPGPYPGEDSPVGYPTPVPGGPVGPGATIPLMSRCAERAASIPFTD